MVKYIDNSTQWWVYYVVGKIKQYDWLVNALIINESEIYACNDNKYFNITSYISRLFGGNQMSWKVVNQGKLISFENQQLWPMRFALNNSAQGNLISDCSLYKSAEGIIRKKISDKEPLYTVL